MSRLRARSSELCKDFEVLTILAMITCQVDCHGSLPRVQLLPLQNSHPTLEAQQRCFSYRTILVATVSQNSFVLVFMEGGGVIAPLSRDML